MGTEDTVAIKQRKPAQQAPTAQQMPEIRIKAGTRTEDEKRREMQMQKVKEEISHTGIFAIINKQGAQNVVLVRNELTPAQLKELTKKAKGINVASVTPETKKKASTEGTIAKK